MQCAACLGGSRVMILHQFLRVFILLVQQSHFLPQIQDARILTMFLLTLQEVVRIILFQNVRVSMDMLMFNNKEFAF